MEQSVKNPNALCLCSISVGISIVGKIVNINLNKAYFCATADVDDDIPATNIGSNSA